VVLTKLMSEIGAARLQPRPVRKPEKPLFFTPELLLSPTSRWPTRLPDATVNAVMSWPVPVAEAVLEEPTMLSVVVVVFNGLVYTRMCLTSLLLSMAGSRFEVIVVDNASTDGTREYLREVAEANPQVRVVSNDTNRGYAAANNQGLALARGRFLLLLNNDTIVPDRRSLHFMQALQDPSVGLASPVTNRTCNEAQIHTSYRTYGELRRFIRDLAEDQARARTDLDMVAFYCVGMRRDVYERIGPLDEQFGLGMYEDNDYSMRVRQAGYRIVCAEDAFVHHFGQGTVGELCAGGDYDALLNGNRRRFEEKWGITWTPPKKRITPEYEQLRNRIRSVAAQHVPVDATVVVVSMGDEELLRLDGRRAWHFPQREDGSYPYIYPANSDEAIHHLNALRTRGATHFLLPKPGFWWRDYYGEFGNYLGKPLVTDDGCLIFSLDQSL
jgi:GT2 family glycosyltransferase